MKVLVEANRQDIRQLAAIAQTQQQTLQSTADGFYAIASALIEELRGLRAENREILAHLFGEPEG